MTEQRDDSLKNLVNSSSSNNSPQETFFCNDEVKRCKEKGSYSSLDIVKILLRERALKQVELADKVGLSRQALNNYLRGFWDVPTQIKIKIAVALGVDSSVIWDLNNIKSNKQGVIA